MSLVSRDEWRATWESEGEPEEFAYLDEIAAALPSSPGLSFLELGCAPGGILAQVCQRFGYIAYGVDHVADVVRIRQLLERRSIAVGEIVNADVLEWQPGRSFDVVASFGLIEHFRCPETLVGLHFKLVRPRGIVVIGVPNFARGQLVIRWLFDREDLNRHNRKCMRLSFFREMAERHGAELRFLRHVGGHFGYWCSATASQGWLSHHLRPRLVAGLKSLADRLPPGSNPVLSPYIVGIFQSADSPGC